MKQTIVAGGREGGREGGGERKNFKHKTEKYLGIIVEINKSTE